MKLHCADLGYAPADQELLQTANNRLPALFPALQSHLVLIVDHMLQEPQSASEHLSQSPLMSGLQVIQQLQVPAASGLIPQELLGKLPQRWEPAILGLPQQCACNDPSNWTSKC